jgi:DNA sulfur modification protein DndC
MTTLEIRRTRDRLSPNASLPNSLVYSPIEEWSNDDVWLYLMQSVNPWGYDNKDLLTMYQGASADGECPLVVDTTTPSCGDSRFGCWVCTLVDKDKSMQAMILNDEEKEWMIPLLELRNDLDLPDDRPLRDFRRMNGNVQLFNGRPIPGPYTQEARGRWLRRVLEAQELARSLGPPEMAGIELITLPELAEIRRIWVVEKHEFEDTLPAIYKEGTGRDFPGDPLDDHLPFGAEELAVLAEVCGDDRLHFEMVRELIDVERRHRAMVRRTGVFKALEDGLRRGFYTDEQDATDRATWRAQTIADASSRPDADEDWIAVAMEPHP